WHGLAHATAAGRMNPARSQKKGAN
ncbi:MAG: hypothetical protein KJZ52_11225, partial [Anaerolineales bacterium]|nr:hypothetical protein [Anaerolineales bacterium]